MDREPKQQKKWPLVVIFWREPGATFLGPEAIPKIQEKCNFKLFSNILLLLI